MSTISSAPAVGTIAELRQGLSQFARSYSNQLRADLDFNRLLRLGVIAAEFALIVAAFRLTHIETTSFELIATIALAGFLFHHFLPEGWRQSFFAALSVASVPLVFGWAHGAWLLGMGVLLIALCHLPVAVWMRVILVVLAAVVMAAERKQLLPWVSPIPTTIWPILGSMFMFRLIVYIYDLRHGAGPFSVGRALSYFFMLPNVCFPLFPVVDYKTLQRSAYNADPLLLYHTGVKWMLRGLVQLALYKAVYFVGVIEPSEAVNGLGAARYMIATFLLYLKISGLFHLIVGLLHMYGFGLAETHHLFLFSSSFTDFWRRINIYWKDFIEKLVFKPAYFLLRKLGETQAIIAATLTAFAVTWFLHSYQWFWIRGEFPIVWADLVFWLGLGMIVLVNVLLEARKGRQRSLTKQAKTVREHALLAMKIAATFTTICILWTIWSTPNVEELALVWRALLNSGPLDLAVLIGVPIGMGLIGALFRHRPREVFGVGTRTAGSAKAFWTQAAIVSVVAGTFIVVGLRPTLLEPISPALATLVNDVVQRVQLNAADSAKLHRGYYEDLGDVTRFNSELWTMYGGRPAGWDDQPQGWNDRPQTRKRNDGPQGWNDQPQTRKRNDGIGEEFIPSSAHVLKGALRTINSLGMRDREYSVEKGPNTFRIGLVGSSHDMGTGVGDNETYENLVEDRLNHDFGPTTGKRFEILNFSHSGYNATQKLSVIEQRIVQFHPDMILYVAHSGELGIVFRHVQHLVDHNLLNEFPFINRAMERAGIKVEAGKALPAKFILRDKLAPFAEDTLRAVLQRFRDGALSKGIRPALVLLEIPSDSPSRPKSFDRLLSIGESIKLPVLDLQGSFSSKLERNSLWIAPWDDHTNAEGHRLLADRLFSLLLKERLIPTQAPARSSEPQPQE